VVRRADRRARPPTRFSDASGQTCLKLTALYGLPPLQTTGLVASLVTIARLDPPTPDFSTRRLRRKGLDVAVACRPAKGAPHLLIDSAGSEVADVGGEPMPPALLDQMRDDRPIDAVTTPHNEGMHPPAGRWMRRSTLGLSRRRRRRGAQAAIPPRQTGKPWRENTPGAPVRDEAARQPLFWTRHPAMTERLSPPKPGRDETLPLFASKPLRVNE
jgi:hypothetical protein